MDKKRRLKFIILLSLGVISIILFLLFYGAFLLRPWIEPSDKGIWFFNNTFIHFGVLGLFIILSLIFLNFIFLMYYKKEDITWKTKGIYTAFIISLFGEMYGAALIVYFFAPFFKYPILNDLYKQMPLRNNLYGFAIFLILISLLLITFSWKQLYLSKGLATKGIYKFLRHPQYLGFILVLIGWFFIWPSLILIILFPLYLFIYIRQAYKEDKKLEKEYGKKFSDYKKNTPMFLPIMLKRR